jgi:hypothetical protein
MKCTSNFTLIVGMKLHFLLFFVCDLQDLYSYKVLGDWKRIVPIFCTSFSMKYSSIFPSVPLAQVKNNDK